MKPEKSLKSTSNFKESLCNPAKTLYRKQESVMTRLRIGYTWITHNYLLKKEDQPFCYACHSPSTVKHVLIELSDFTRIRNWFYTATDVHTLFREVDSSRITKYLQEIKPYDKIWNNIYENVSILVNMKFQDILLYLCTNIQLLIISYKILPSF